MMLGWRHLATCSRGRTQSLKSKEKKSEDAVHAVDNGRSPVPISSNANAQNETWRPTIGTAAEIALGRFGPEELSNS